MWPDPNDEADGRGVGECDGREKALTAVPFVALLGLVGSWRYRSRRRGG
jgi:MYXO-CTERM domain-containing protein